MKKYIYLVFFFIIPCLSSVNAQDFVEILFVPINNGQTFTVCEEGFDYGLAGSAGGQGGGGGAYENNQNITITLCPALAGDVVSVDFTVCFLNTQGSPDDEISIWDGDNTSEPSLGSYTGTALEGLIVTASIYNTTGCLTLRLKTNNVGTGNILAGISCDTPCARPTAAGTYDAPNEGKICIGDLINFDGSASFAADGYEIDQYLWNFGDGTIDSTSGPYVSHVFDEIGEHIVELYIFDNNGEGCVSSNRISLQLLVSTIPDWDPFPQDTTLCLGESLALVVHPDDFEVTWTGFPDVNFGSPVYVPDCFGSPYTSSINYSAFDPGQTLTDINDLLDICIDFEHTFLGDLVIDITCPSGASTILHQQGTGADGDYNAGMFLGQACDADGNCTDCELPECTIPGVPYHYCWSPNAILGSWSQEANAPPDYTETYLGLDGVTYTNQPILEPNTYNIPTPSDWNNLIGCPLNGEWTITFTDFWGADNGNLSGWEINFNPDIIPDVTVFTPQIGHGADSSGWSGPDIIYTNYDQDSIIVQPSGLGTFEYTFFVLNNHGCQYDSSITVTVIPGPVAYAGEDVYLCSDSVQLNAWIEGEIAPPDECTYTLDMNAFDGFGWGGSTITVSIDGVIIGDYSVLADWEGGNGFTNSAVFIVPGGSTIDFEVNAFFAWDMNFEILDGSETSLYSDGPSPVNGSGYSTSCGNAGNYQFSWTPTSGLSDPTIRNPMVLVNSATTYTVEVYPTGHPVCSSADQVTVFSVAECYAGEDAEICDASYQLQASPIGGVSFGNWTAPAAVTILNSNSNNAIASTSTGGKYDLIWTVTSGDCIKKDTVSITLSPPLTINISTVGANCADSCNGSASVVVTGGILNLTSPDYEFSWEPLVGDVTTESVSQLCAGNYTFTVTDNIGCSEYEDFVITEPAPLSLNVLTEPALCANDCNAKITVFSPTATLISFDGGATFGTISELIDCAGSFDIVVKNSQGCSASESVFLPQPDSFMANFIMSPQPTTVDATEINFTNLSGPSQIDSSIWTFGSIPILGISDVKNPTYLFPSDTSGLYPVELIVIDANGCRDTLTKNVVILDNSSFFIPNGFSPNGDGINDVFKPVLSTVDVTDYKFVIYNRWGEQIFETTDVTKGWNGTGKDGNYVTSDGVYVYIIQLSSASTKEKEVIKGYVTIAR
jgi:gliding motility-associated-like protein